MPTFARPSALLRQALLMDAVVSGAMGLLLIFGAGLLTGLLDLPVTLLRTAGIVLLPFVAFVAFVAGRAQLAPAAVWIVILVNALWVLASVGLLLSGWVTPNALGIAFVIVQAVAVGLFAELQYLGLRRTPPAVAH